jgi:putative SOS response-associated peptidase YedK
VQARSLDDLLADFEAGFVGDGAADERSVDRGPAGEGPAGEGSADEPAVADYNVAPTKPVPVIVHRNRPGDRGGPALRHLRTARWGLIPSWSKDATGAAKRINARVETVTSTPAFRIALARRRCLIPADGWYEWARREDGSRQPTYLHPRAGGGLAFAGLYEFWTGPAGKVTSCAIITTAAVDELTTVHDRMPLVLPRTAWAGWLDPAGEPGELLGPPSSELVAGIALRPVGAAVGNVNNAGPELIAAVRPAPVAQALF